MSTCLTRGALDRGVGRGACSVILTFCNQCGEAHFAKVGFVRTLGREKNIAPLNAVDSRPSSRLDVKGEEACGVSLFYLSPNGQKAKLLGLLDNVNGILVFDISCQDVCAKGSDDYVSGQAGIEPKNYQISVTGHSQIIALGGTQS